MKQYDIFLSYSHSDANEFADWLCSRLTEQGLSVFIDKAEIMIGDEIIERLTDGVHNSTYFVMLMTPNYFKSGWCRKELFQILTKEANESQNVILPVVVSRVDIPPYISSKVWFSLNPDNWTECVEKISNRVKRDRKQRQLTQHSEDLPKPLRPLDLAKDNPTVDNQNSFDFLSINSDG